MVPCISVAIQKKILPKASTQTASPSFASAAFWARRTVGTGWNENLTITRVPRPPRKCVEAQTNLRYSCELPTHLKDHQMAATGWTYYVPYQQDPERALQELRNDVFARGAYT